MLPSVDIILPCYNPQKRWEDNVISVFSELQKELSDTCKLNLIIVNDGSSTNLNESIKKIKEALKEGFQYFSYDVNKGKGFAIRNGFKKSKSDFIVYTDIDFPYSNKSILDVIHCLINFNYEVILTKRESDYYEIIGLTRKYISKILKFVIRYFLRMKFLDTQAGLKGVNSKGKEVFLKTTINRYLFDLEFVKLSYKNKLNVNFVDIKLRKGTVIAGMNIKVIFSELLNFFRIILT